MKSPETERTWPIVTLHMMVLLMVIIAIKPRCVFVFFLVYKHVNILLKEVVLG